MEYTELNLSAIRKKYKGRKINLEKPHDCEAWFTEETMEMELEFTYLNWAGDELRYDIVIKLNPDFTIKQIGALHCSRLAGEDAASVSYRGKKAEESDYRQLEKQLKQILEDE
jgi:hypothetical protein